MANPARKNAEDSVIIHFGANLSQLAQLFDMPPKRVTARLSGRVSPMTAAGDTAPRWRVKDAAPYLVNPKVDVEELLRTLTPAKLPPKLQQAFWTAQNERTDFEERAGDLFNATRVREMLAKFAKPMRMTLLMAKDTVGQQVELSVPQRRILDEIVDSLLCQLRDGILEAFGDYEPPDDEHGRSIDEIANAAEESMTGDDSIPLKRGPGRPKKNAEPVGENRFIELEEDAFDDGFDDD